MLIAPEPVVGGGEEETGAVSEMIDGSVGGGGNASRVSAGGAGGRKVYRWIAGWCENPVGPGREVRVVIAPVSGEEYSAERCSRDVAQGEAELRRGGEMEIRLWLVPDIILIGGDGDWDWE